MKNQLLLLDEKKGEKLSIGAAQEREEKLITSLGMIMNNEWCAVGDGAPAIQ